MPLGSARFGLLGGVLDLGKLELIETQTYSSATANIDFTSIDESKYNVHFMTFNNVITSGGASPDLSVRFYESGVLETYDKNGKKYIMKIYDYFYYNGEICNDLNSLNLKYLYFGLFVFSIYVKTNKCKIN